ncbi:MAG: hypothetical protein RRY23_00740 [Alistipes sp.]
MKKSLLTKLFAIFLVGSLLTAVGCKNYDGDIDNLNNKIDQLATGAVATMATQVTALQGSVQSLQTMDQQLDAAIKALKVAQGQDATAIEALKAQIKTLEDAKKDLQKQIDKINETLKTVASKSYVDQSIANLNTVYASIGSVTALQKQVDTLIAGLTEAMKLLPAQIQDEVKKQVDAAMETLRNEIKNAADKALADAKAAMGPAIKDALAAYTTSAELTAKINALIAAAGHATSAEAKAALEAAKKAQDELDAFKSTFTQTVADQISAAITTNNGVIDTKIATAISTAMGTLKQDVATLTTRVEDLEAKVAILEGRIQSLVFVPESLQDAVNGNCILFRGAQYFWWDSAEKQYLRNDKSEVATMTFRVTPASLAKVFATNPAALSMVSEKINVYSRAADDFTILSVVADPDAANNGKFVVTASSTYDFAANWRENNKTLAIALHIDGTEFAGMTSDIDYTSSFTPIWYQFPSQLDDPADVTERFVLAHNTANAGEPAVYTEYNVADVAELKYTDVKTVVNFLEGYDIMYRTPSNTIISLAEAQAKYNWDIDFATLGNLKPVAAGVPTFTPDTHKKDYTVGTNKLSLQIKTSSAALIDDVITSANISYKFVSGQKKMTVISDAQQVVNIVSDGISTTAENAALTWTLAIAQGTRHYTAEPVKLASGIPAATYVALKGTPYTVTLTDAAGKAVTAITGTIALPSQPTADTDLQNATITLHGDLSATENYTLKAVYKLGDKSTVTINGTVSVTGLPAIAALTATQNFTYESNKLTYEIAAFKDYAKTMFASMNAAAAKKAFVDEKTFVTAVTAATFTPTPVEKHALAVAGKNMNVVFDKDVVLNTAAPYELTGDITAAWGLNVPVTANVKLVVPALKLSEGTSLKKDGTADVITALKGKDLVLTGLDLSTVYFYDGTAPGVTVKYTIKTTQTTKKSTITGALLNWGTWNKTDLTIEAQLMIDKYNIGEAASFVAKIKDPIVGAIAVDQAKAVIGANREKDEILNIASLLTLKDLNDKNVFNATGLETDQKAALNAKVTYGLIDISNQDGRVSFNETTGEITAAKSELTMATPVTVKVKVTYKYTFGERTQDVTVTVSQKK